MKSLFLCILLMNVKIIFSMVDTLSLNVFLTYSKDNKEALLSFERMQTDNFNYQVLIFSDGSEHQIIKNRDDYHSLKETLKSYIPSDPDISSLAIFINQFVAKQKVKNLYFNINLYLSSELKEVYNINKLFVQRLIVINDLKSIGKEKNLSLNITEL